MPNQRGTWDAIIVNYNGGLFLEPCIRALRASRVLPGRVLIVDNASTDDSLNELAAWPEVEVIQSPTNLGYAGGANLGVVSSDAPLAVLLNPDVEVDPAFGANAVALFDERPGLGAAGGKLRFPESGRVQHAGGVVHMPGLTTSHVGEGEPDHGQFEESRQADYVTGAALAVRRSAFDEVGGFDESFYPAYWEDVDLCWTMRAAGWEVRFEPSLTAIHHEGSGQSRGDDYFAVWTRNRLRFAMKHLSPADWWRSFIPAEVERLRGEISAAETPAWYVRSGGTSIEMLARSSEYDVSTDASVSDPLRLLDSITAIQALPDLADPRPGPIQPSDGVGRRIKRFLSRFSGRIYAEELYWQQRQFNESVVRAFEAQDRFNREQVAQLLFTLLLIAGRQTARRDSDAGGDPGEQHPGDLLQD